MEGLGSLLLFAVLFYVLMRFGCGAHMMHGHGGRNQAKKNAAQDSKYIDPVCKMEVDANKGYGEMYQSELYRFCSKNCLDKFDAGPKQYVSKEVEVYHDNQRS